MDLGSIRFSFEQCVAGNPEWLEWEKQRARKALDRQDWDGFDRLLAEKGYRLFIDSRPPRVG